MELTHENLINLMRFRPTLKEASEYFNTSEDTVERRIHKWEKTTFSIFKEKHSRSIKYKLIDKAIDMAMSGNSTMMIFALKNICGWGDRAEVTKDSEPKVINFKYSMNDLKSEVSLADT